MSPYNSLFSITKQSPTGGCFNVMKDFKSPKKTVGGNEGDKCNYPTRLDTYGCGCSHDCSYCYAKSLLDFRNLWNPTKPSVGDIKAISRVVKKLPRKVVRQPKKCLEMYI